jgi:hypothetical protein
MPSVKPPSKQKSGKPKSGGKAKTSCKPKSGGKPVLTIKNAKRLFLFLLLTGTSVLGYKTYKLLKSIYEGYVRSCNYEKVMFELQMRNATNKLTKAQKEKTLNNLTPFVIRLLERYFDEGILMDEDVLDADFE